jgi:methyl-accepting chemotaxis protein PixJ
MVANNSISDYQNFQPEPVKSAVPMAKKPSNLSVWVGHSLRAKATAVAIALGTLPVILIGSAAYVAMDRTFAQQIEAQQINESTQISDKLNRFIFERYGDVQVLANLPFLKNSRLQSTMTLQEKQQVLDQYAQTYVVYDSISVIDLQGNLMVQSKSEPLGNQRQQSYFQEVLKGDRPTVGTPEISSTSGVLSLHFAAPVKDSVTGKTIAIVRTRMPIEKLDQVVASYANGGNEYYVADHNGKIFMSNDTEKISLDLNKNFPKLAALGGKPGATYEFTPREELIGSTTTPTFQGMPNLGWSTTLATEKATAFKAQGDLGHILAFGTLLAAGAVAALGALIANCATRPLQTVAQALEKIGQGDLSTSIQVKGQDELAMLGNNINQMTRRIQALLQQQEGETQRANLFAAIALKMRQSIDTDEIFNRVVQDTRAALRADRVVIYRFNPDWSGYIFAEDVLAGFPQALADKIEDSCIGETLINAYKEGRVVPTNNVFTAGFHPEHLDLMKRLQIKANLVTPIIWQGELFGLLIAHHCAAPHVWLKSEIDLLFQLSIQVGYALDQASSVARIEQARVEARQEAEQRAGEQQEQKETIQRRALELLMEVDPVSHGDLTIRAKVTPDEIGTIADSYNAIIGSLRHIVGQVKTASQAVTETATGSEVAVHNLSQEATHQIVAIADALTQIQAMAISIQGVGDRAKQAEQGVRQANLTIQAGDEAMNRTVVGISTIRETVAETAKKVKRLGEASQKISKVVNLIGDFASQTNLLALNAAIEAARAGEEGRGFAVVAEEVRSLAQQSATATAEIESLVEEIQTQTNEVVAAMEAGTEQVVAGTQLVEETRSKLSQIATVGNSINQLVAEISQATAVQTQASTTVSATMQQVAAIANGTSEQSEIVAQSFSRLLLVAEELQVSMAQFKVS